MRRASWAVVAAFVVVTLYNVSKALGLGEGDIRHYHEPPAAGVFAIGSFVLFLVAFGVSVAAIARPTWIVALFTPLYALCMLAADFSYDSYYAPDLQRYWDGAGDHTRIYVGVVLAFVIGGGSLRFPRTAGAANLVGLPLTFVLTITYLGH